MVANKKIQADEDVLQNVLQIAGLVSNNLGGGNLTPPPPAPETSYFSNIYDRYKSGFNNMGLYQRDGENIPDAVARNIGAAYDFAFGIAPEKLYKNLAAGGAQVYSGLGGGAEWLGRTLDSPEMTNVGSQIRQVGTAAYQKNAPQNPGMLDEVIQQVPFMASALVPGLGAGSLAGRGALALATRAAVNPIRATQIASGVGALGTGLTQATFEGIIEAGDKHNEWLKEHPGDEAGAIEVGKKTLAGNVGLLGASDTAQAMLMFKKFRAGYDTILKNIEKSPTLAKAFNTATGSAGLRVAAQMALEGNEEAQQTNIGNWAQGKETNIMPWNWTPEQWHEAQVAGLTAGLFGGAAAIGEKINDSLVKKGEELNKLDIMDRALPVEVNRNTGVLPEPGIDEFAKMVGTAMPNFSNSDVLNGIKGAMLNNQNLSTDVSARMEELSRKIEDGSITPQELSEAKQFLSSHAKSSNYATIRSNINEETLPIFADRLNKIINNTANVVSIGEDKYNQVKGIIGNIPVDKMTPSQVTQAMDVLMGGRTHEQIISDINSKWKKPVIPKVQVQAPVDNQPVIETPVPNNQQTTLQAKTPMQLKADAARKNMQPMGVSKEQGPEIQSPTQPYVSKHREYKVDLSERSKIVEAYNSLVMNEESKDTTLQGRKELLFNIREDGTLSLTARTQKGEVLGKKLRDILQKNNLIKGENGGQVTSRVSPSTEQKTPMQIKAEERRKNMKPMGASENQEPEPVSKKQEEERRDSPPYSDYFEKEHTPEEREFFYDRLAELEKTMPFKDAIQQTDKDLEEFKKKNTSKGPILDDEIKKSESSIDHKNTPINNTQLNRAIILSNGKTVEEIWNEIKDKQPFHKNAIEYWMDWARNNLPIARDFYEKMDKSPSAMAVRGQDPLLRQKQLMAALHRMAQETRNKRRYEKEGMPQPKIDATQNEDVKRMFLEADESNFINDVTDLIREEGKGPSIKQGFTPERNSSGGSREKLDKIDFYINSNGMPDGRNVEEVLDLIEDDEYAINLIVPEYDEDGEITEKSFRELLLKAAEVIEKFNAGFLLSNGALGKQITVNVYSPSTVLDADIPSLLTGLKKLQKVLSDVNIEKWDAGTLYSKGFEALGFRKIVEKNGDIYWEAPYGRLTKNEETNKWEVNGDRIYVVFTDTDGTVKKANKKEMYYNPKNNTGIFPQIQSDAMSALLRVLTNSRTELVKDANGNPISINENGKKKYKTRKIESPVKGIVDRISKAPEWERDNLPVIQHTLMEIVSAIQRHEYGNLFNFVFADGKLGPQSKHDIKTQHGLILEKNVRKALDEHFGKKKYMDDVYKLKTAMNKFFIENKREANLKDVEDIDKIIELMGFVVDGERATADSKIEVDNPDAYEIPEEKFIGIQREHGSQYIADKMKNMGIKIKKETQPDGTVKYIVNPKKTVTLKDYLNDLNDTKNNWLVPLSYNVVVEDKENKNSEDNKNDKKIETILNNGMGNPANMPFIGGENVDRSIKEANNKRKLGGLSLDEVEGIFSEQLPYKPFSGKLNYYYDEISKTWHAYSDSGVIYRLQREFYNDIIDKNGISIIKPTLDWKMKPGALNKRIKNIISNIITKSKERKNDGKIGSVSQLGAISNPKLSESSSVNTAEPKGLDSISHNLATFANMFGINQIHIYDSPALNENGFYHNGKIYINKRSSKPMEWIFSHELIHHIKKADPKVYYYLARSLNITDDMRLQYVLNNRSQETIKKWVKEDMSGVKLGNEGYIDEEMIGDEIANQMYNPKFWEFLENKNRGLVSKIIKIISDFIKSIFVKNKENMNLPIQNSYLNGRAPDMLQTRGDILRDKMQQMFLATQGIQRISYSTAEQAVKTRFINNSFKTKWTEKEKEEMANDYKALIDSGMSPDSLRWAFNVAESSHVGFINAINRTFETMFGEDNLNIKTTSKDTDMGFFESIFRSPSLFKQSVIKQIYHLARDLHRNEMRKRDDFLGQYADIVKNLSKEEIKTLNSVRMNNDTLHREQYQHQQIGSNSFKVLTPDDIRISFSRGDNMDVGVLKSLINQDINFGTSKRVSYTQLISVLKSLGYTADKFVKTYSTAVGKESQTVQVYAYKGERKTYNTEQEARKVALEETKKYISDTHGDKIGKAYKELRDLYDNLHNITNLARKNAGLPDLGYIDGYFPHMFGSYAVLVKDNGVWESIRTFDTMYDAVDWVKHDSGFSDMQMKNMIVTPNTYDSSTTDVTFYTLNGDAISDAERLELGKFLNQDMREMISGEFKERFFGNTKRRYSNNDGWLKDVTDVDKRYINGLIRYNLHNDFRQRAINIYERQWGTGSFRDEATTPMQKWVKQYINDVDGKPSFIEDVFSKWLDKPENQQTKMMFEKFFGASPMRNVVNNIVEVVTVAKLGLFNASSTFLQATQLLNTNAIIGENYVSLGVKDTYFLSGQIKNNREITKLAESYRKKMNNPSLGKITEEERLSHILFETGVDVDVAIDMDAIYAMHSGNYFGDTLGDKWKSFKNETIGNKIRIFGQISLHTFRWADQKTRMISVFGAYRKAIADGKSESDAIKYAEEVNRRANFDYSTSDSSGLFRKLGPIGKIFLQFKKYATKEMELLFSISPTFNFLNEKFWTKENFARPEFARFMGYQTALAGLGGIPMWALMNSLWPSLLGDDPDKRIKKYLIQNMDKGPFERFVALQVMYGMFASISDPFAKGSGVDMHTRLGTSDIIPTDVKSTLLGPFFNTFAQFTKAINDNWGATGVVAPEIANTISPMLGNIGRAIRGEERSLVDKQRVTVKYDWTDRAERLLGFKPVESTLSSDTTQLVKSEQEKMKMERKKAIEIAMKLRDDGSPMTSEVANKLKEFKITPKMLDEEFKKRNQERLERVKGNLTKAQKSSSEIKGLLD